MVGGVAVIFGVLLVWGLLHQRGSQRVAAEKIKEIELAEIPGLAKECVDVFKNKLGIDLDLNDLENAAEQIDEALQDVSKLKGPFAKDDCYWHFVRTVGAFIGELLRIHAKHVWVKRHGEAPHMECSFSSQSLAAVSRDLEPIETGMSETCPFDKVLSIASQLSSSEPGDVYAYIAAAKALAGQ
jgi:hypothetical protein